MRRILAIWLLLTAAAAAQRVNTVHVNQFAGVTLGQKTLKAQQSCDSRFPCILIFDADLGVYPVGTMPLRGSRETWMDYTQAGKLRIDAFLDLSGATIAPAVWAARVGTPPDTFQLQLGTAGAFQYEIAPKAGGGVTFRPITDNASDIGDATHQVRDVWVSGTIHGGAVSAGMPATLDSDVSTAAGQYTWTITTTDGGTPAVPTWLRTGDNTGNWIQLWWGGGSFVNDWGTGQLASNVGQMGIADSAHGGAWYNYFSDGNISPVTFHSTYDTTDGLPMKTASSATLPGPASFFEYIVNQTDGLHGVPPGTPLIGVSVDYFSNRFGLYTTGIQGVAMALNNIPIQYPPDPDDQPLPLATLEVNSPHGSTSDDDWDALPQLVLIKGTATQTASILEMRASDRATVLAKFDENGALTIPGCTGCTPPVLSGTAVLGTSEIAAASCASAVTVAATGVVTTDVISFTPNADITGVTGYGPTGTLTIYPYPTAGNVNFKVCNGDAANPVTPGAVTLNWRVAQ